MMLKRIALLGITHESNTFVKEPTAIEDFKNGHWFMGTDIRKEYTSAFHEIGGMIEVIDAAGMELLPVMYAEATPGGTITAEAYSVLLKEMMLGLENIMPVDAVLVVPHGAGVCESFPDMDGHWLSLVRERVGMDIPIIGTIDPHANVSPLMISSTNALVAYKTNPHIDQREAGKEAAGILISTLTGMVKPIQKFIQLPVAISIEQQLTENDPCKSVLKYARELSCHSDILSISLVLGFPYADVKEMGSSIIVVADGNIVVANAIAESLENYILQNCQQFNGQKNDIRNLLHSIQQFEKPILMLDMGDNIGGGSSGDSTYLLDILEEAQLCSFCIVIYDPAAVKEAQKYQTSDIFEIKIGNRPDEYSSPERKVQLIRVADGQFLEHTPRHGGQVKFDMGTIAIVSTVSNNIIMLTSLRVPPYSLNQLTAFGIQAHEYDVLIAKGVNAPIAAYKDVCKTILQVDTPGVTQADMTRFKYKNRRQPLFPFEVI